MPWPLETASPPGGGVNRREFLTLTSTAAAGACWAGGTAASTLLGLHAPLDLPLSVGYLAGSDEYPHFGVLPWNLPYDPLAPPELEVVNADRLPLGDQTLAGGVVWMSVHGLYPRLPNRRVVNFRSVNLVVLFPSEDPARPASLPFVSWGLRRTPAPSHGARNHFVVPLRVEDGGLVLALEITRNIGGVLSTDRSFADFTVDWQDGRPKLQRGIYFLGLTPATWKRGDVLPTAGEAPRDELCSLVVSFEPIREP